jgi:asparagine N-glycosylation enzyme membrane subunit Stt3
MSRRYRNSSVKRVVELEKGCTATVLMIVFGLGVWLSANGNRALRVTGAVLIGYGVANLVALLFPLDLSSNASVPLHIVATNMLLVLMLAAMGFGAAAFHGWFRLYSIASLVTSVVAGVVSFLAAPYAPTPVLGIGERISIGAFLLWVAVLAVALWRALVEAAGP